MLRSLYVRDYALIEELDVEFASGLNIITGETGAGKSILIGALNMIIGERASTDVVRSGAKKAVIEGIFDEADVPEVIELLEENAIEPRDHLFMRREITGSYSRAFINDTPATVQLMREVAAHLIDLHGQHEHQSLLRTETHLGLLDNFGGLEGLRESYREAYKAVAALVDERDDLVARERELTQQKELYGFQMEEIDAVNPQEGEEDNLTAERRVLENAERLYSATAELHEMLYEGDRAVHDTLVQARNEMRELARIDEAFDDSFSELKSAQIMVSEIANFLQDYNARIEFNPERLERIRERLSEIDRLKRKYGGTLEAVLAHRQEIGEQFALASNFEEAIERLNEEIEGAQNELSELAARLSAKRHEVAQRIEQAIVAELATLGMPDSQFDVRFTQAEKTDGWIRLTEGSDEHRYEAFSDGMDRVEFFISTNVGEEPKPLKKVASGGEVSRIMLALKTILAKSERLPILVFDEIDTGISGAIANRVGQSMHDLASYHQIIAITHLPQIAALADQHYVVEKMVEGERTKTQIQQLSAEERAVQVASLMSGHDVTDAALESARQMMEDGTRDTA